MNRLSTRDIVVIVILMLVFCLLMQGWNAIVAFLGILLAAIVPLLVGIAIAYVVSIPTNFLKRHILPNSTSRIIGVFRQPVSLLVTIIGLLVAVGLSSAVLLPALTDTVIMVQKNGQQFVEDIIQTPIMEPVRESIHQFLEGDFIQSLKRLDIKSVVDSVFGGTVGSITTQVFTVVSTAMTAFFGMLFSFILLTDTTGVGNEIMQALSQYLGPKRTERLALVIGVADASFHNFIVRQCVEAAILSAVGTTLLLAMGFPYAWGVGALMALAALVPIVGYPVGLLTGAFMVAISDVWLALLYIAVVAVAQMLEATLLLPHVGDPRTALPPVWITVGVTIGGGVAGFIGMLVAIPIASTIRQLIIIDIKRRQAAAAFAEAESKQANDS